MEKIFLVRGDNPERKLYKCGHEGPKTFIIKIFRDTTEVKENEGCPDCLIAFLKNFSIPCSFCYRPIIPGNQVTRIGDGIGCLRRVCRPGMPSGIWSGREILSYNSKIAAK